jgi:hypothetical protein
VTDYTGAPPSVVQSDTVELDDGRTRCCWYGFGNGDAPACGRPGTHQIKVARMWLTFCAKHPTRAYAEGRKNRQLPPRMAVRRKRVP